MARSTMIQPKSINDDVDYSTKDKHVELVLAHRSIDGIRDDLKTVESLFNSDAHFVYERMMNSLTFMDERITSFLKRSGKAKELHYLQK